MAGSYTSPTGTVRVDFESSPNEHRVTDDVPAHIVDDTVRLVKLHPRISVSIKTQCRASPASVTWLMTCFHSSFCFTFPRHYVCTLQIIQNCPHQHEHTSPGGKTPRIWSGIANANCPPRNTTQSSPKHAISSEKFKNFFWNGA